MASINTLDTSDSLPSSPSVLFQEPLVFNLSLSRFLQVLAGSRRRCRHPKRLVLDLQEETLTWPLPEEEKRWPPLGYGSAANPNASVGPSGVEVSIVCDHDGWSCFRDDDVMQQQSAIRVEDAASLLRAPTLVTR